MKFSASIVAVALFVAGVVAQSTPMINTPENVVVCEPTLLTFSGGVPPYILNVLPGSQPSAAPLEQYTGLTGTSFTWNSNIAAGTQIGLTLRDSTGASGQTAPFPINSGGDTSCLASASGGGASSGASTATSGASSVPSSGTGSASSATSTAASTTPSATSPTPSTTPSATSTHATSTASDTSSHSSATSGSPTPSPSATGSDAGALSASLGFAGVVGLAVAAILA